MAKLKNLEDEISFCNHVLKENCLSIHDLTELNYIDIENENLSYRIDEDDNYSY